MDAEYIANKARKAISSYCYEECRSYCCRKGYLTLTEKQADLILEDKKEEYEKEGALKKMENGLYSLNMGKADKPCPRLIDYKCSIHKNRNRPKACRKFPIFIEGDIVKLSHRCYAVREGKLYPFIRQWKSMGLKVIESDSFYDLDRYSNFE